MNEHWRVIAAGGVVISASPEGLWEQAVKYFQWCEDNPIKTKKTMQSGKTQGQKVEVEYNRPFTVDGFCLHAGITKRWLTDVKSLYGVDSQWFLIVEKIMSVIYTQNLEGAIVDLFNPIVISKILNLDKPQEDDARTVRVEIVDKGQGGLYSSEADVISNLDFEMVHKLQEKVSEKEMEGDTVGKRTSN